MKFVFSVIFLYNERCGKPLFTSLSSFAHVQDSQNEREFKRFRDKEDMRSQFRRHLLNKT